MKSKASLLDKINSLIGRGSERNIVDDGEYRTTTLPHTIISYEYERFLVAWVLLTRLSQSELDQAWRNHGSDLSLFAISLLTDTHDGIETVSDNHRISENGCNRHGYNLLHICYIRLVAQVTGRLGTPPSKDLKLKLYQSWKHMSTILDTKGDTTLSTAGGESRRNTSLVTLNIDVLSALVAWIGQDANFFASSLVMGDIWNAYVSVHSTTEQSAPSLEQVSSGQEKQIASTMVQSNFKNIDGTIMMNILDNLLGRPIEADNDCERGRESIYHVENMQRLMLVIFELQGTNGAPDELLSKILRWSSRREKEMMMDPKLRVLWDGWIIKNVGESLSRNKKNATLLRDPEITDAFQKVMFTHAVSPSEHDLRPMVWQTVSQIIRVFGWSWIQKSSLKISICTWCQLACGELKIQLDEIQHIPSAMPNRCSIMDGCGSIISSIVQYLVRFDQRPDKVIPIGMKSLRIIRKSIEETFSLTSEYLHTSLSVDDDTELALVIHLWSELFSEIDLLSSRETETMIACFNKLLVVSRDESLVRPLVLNALRLITQRSTRLKDQSTLF